MEYHPSIIPIFCVSTLIITFTSSLRYSSAERKFFVLSLLFICLYFIITSFEYIQLERLRIQLEGQIIYKWIQSIKSNSSNNFVETISDNQILSISLWHNKVINSLWRIESDERVGGMEPYINTVLHEFLNQELARVPQNIATIYITN